MKSITFMAGVFLLIVALILFRATFGTYFGVDDFIFIKLADDRGLFRPDLHEFFSRRYLNEVLAFTVARRLFGDVVWLYHAVAFGVHLSCGLLVYRLAMLLRPNASRLALLAAAFFILHPASFSILSWVALGFNEPFALALSLVGTIAFLGFLGRGGFGRALLSIACLPIAAGFKNQAIMIPGLYAAFGLLYARQQRRQGAVETQAWLARAALVLSVCGSFSLWYLLEIVPATGQAQHPAFARSWQPA